MIRKKNSECILKGGAMGTGTKTQILQLSAMEIAQSIRQKKISCEETINSHFGLPVLKDAQPKDDAPHVKNLKNAGAIVIGRTNMPDLGLRLHTDNDLHGVTLNPWDISRTPGGSSGGDAAAVATGMTPLGLGNDYAVSRK